MTTFLRYGKSIYVYSLGTVTNLSRFRHQETNYDNLMDEYRREGKEDMQFVRECLQSDIEDIHSKMHHNIFTFSKNDRQIKYGFATDYVYKNLFIPQIENPTKEVVKELQHKLSKQILIHESKIIDSLSFCKTSPNYKIKENIKQCTQQLLSNLSQYSNLQDLKQIINKNCDSFIKNLLKSKEIRIVSDNEDWIYFINEYVCKNFKALLDDIESNVERQIQLIVEKETQPIVLKHEMELEQKIKEEYQRKDRKRKYISNFYKASIISIVIIICLLNINPGVTINAISIGLFLLFWMSIL